jgi:hypothetical protein
MGLTRHPLPLLLCVLAIAVSAFSLPGQTQAPQGADAGQYRTVDGVAVYLGLMPAAIVRGHPSGHPERTMHGGPPAHAGPPAATHDYHLVAALFDAATGARISDALVSARIAGLGLGGNWTRLEPMQIADTITYGAFVTLPGADRYTIRLEIQRSGSARPVQVDFMYDHRR